MIRKQGSGFKMKRSPVKQGLLSDFFSNIGGKLKKGQKERGIFSETAKAEKRERRKTGESKFQYDVRKKKEAKKAEVKTSTQGFKTYGYDSGYEAPTAPETKPYVKSKSKIKVGAAIPWNKAPKVGTQARTDWYKKFNLKLDETTPGFENTDPSYKTIQGKFGPVSVIDDNPIQKKSPYKKGIGSYAKKAKGSRGYKMKKK